MKLNVVAYLSKKDVKIDDLLNEPVGCEKIDINQKKLNALLCLHKSMRPPKWLDLFNTVKIPNNFKQQKSIKGALFVKYKKYYVVFTFGHGRSMINQELITRGFGLRVAMNIGDSNLLKSIDKSTLDKAQLKTRSQSSRNTGIEDFDFEFDHQIIKSITAIVDNPDDLEIVSGSDSVSLYTDISIDSFKSNAAKLYKAYKSDNYKTNYPWSEYICPESDPIITRNLNEIVIKKLSTGDYSDLWIAPPEIIDYKDFSGFSYKLPSKKSPCIEQELSLDRFLDEAIFRDGITVKTFKSKKIFILNAAEEKKDSWSCFRCLNGEVDYEKERYILNDGIWYKIKDSFYSEVCDYFDSIKPSTLVFPDYGNLPESVYLAYAADIADFLLLDQKWVKPKGVSNNLEFCDLYTKCKSIIHVKKYGSSAVLNHLFAQATQSVEMLMNSPEVLKQVNQHLKKDSVEIIFDSDKSPREHKIVLAIMDKKERNIHMPFFAKVNLRHHVRKIKNLGFEVTLAKIDFGSKVLEKVKLAKKYNITLKKK